MTFRWPQGHVMRFLELYQRQECLWNHNLQSYKNKEARENALHLIHRQMGIPELTIADVKTKIKSIRTVYKRELEAVLKAKKNLGEVYRPTLFWFKKADSFLKDICVSRNNAQRSNLIFNEPVEEIDEEAEHEEIHRNFNSMENDEAIKGDMLIENDNAIEIDHLDNSICLPPSANVETLLSSSDEDDTIPMKRRKVSFTPMQKSNKVQEHHNRKRKIATFTSVSTLSAAIDRLDRISKRSGLSDGDEFESFGHFIAVQLRQMPLYNALICQEKMYSVIMQQRLQLLSFVNSSSSSPFHSTIVPKTEPE